MANPEPRTHRFSSWPGRAAWFAMALASLSVLAPKMPAADARPLKPIVSPAENRFAPSRLERRRQEEATAAAGMKAFRDFRFTNRIDSSGITFEEIRVDDAAKYWQPAHYDHGGGMAVADVDGDGRLDAYFVTMLGSNALYRNAGGGRFEDITAKAGVALPNQVSYGASFADIDNDGDPDLYVTTVRFGNHLFENLGQGRFRDITAESGLAYTGHSSTALFFDYDNDGLLDMFLCNVGVFTGQTKGRGGYYRTFPDAFQGHLFPERTEHSILYRNLGGRKFRDVSREMNLRDGHWNGDATIVDFNEDRFPDLYIVNMQGDDHYYENQAGKGFIDKTASLFPKTPWGSMGIKSFDYNQDGRLDLFVTDMHSDMTGAQTTAGGRDFRTSFEKVKSDAWCGAEWSERILQGSSNNFFGNAFYENKGAGKFEEVSDRLKVETYWPWGVSLGDFNADGFDDLFVTAGMGYMFRYGINSLLLNEGGRRFFDAEFQLGIEPRAGGIDKNMFEMDCDGPDKGDQRCVKETGRIVIRGSLSSRSSAALDIDDDGDLDILTSENSDRPQVLISNLSERSPIHFLKVKLVGTASNRDALGAVVRVHAGGRVLTQANDGKSGYMAQSSMPLYFGLGTATQVDKIEVRWPSGRDGVYPAVPSVNRQVTLTEETKRP